MLFYKYTYSRNGEPIKEKLKTESVGKCFEQYFQKLQYFDLDVHAYDVIFNLFWLFVPG